MSSTNRMAGATIEEQTRQSLRNCAAIIAAGGGTLDDVVQVTVLLANPADFAGMNEEYAKVFAVDPPARAVTKLGVELPNVLGVDHDDGDHAGPIQRAGPSLREVRIE